MKLTQEQLAELIAKVFSNLDERRKACKEGEVAPGGFSTDEIMSEVNNILNALGGEGFGEGEGEGVPLPQIPPLLILCHRYFCCRCRKGRGRRYGCRRISRADR